jgi:hypothetical protein
MRIKSDERWSLCWELRSRLRAACSMRCNHISLMELPKTLSWVWIGYTGTNPHINSQQSRLILYNMSTRSRCIIKATEVTTKRPNHLVSAKLIARFAKKKLPMYILHVGETDDVVPEDSDFHSYNKPETDPVEDGKTRLKSKMKRLLQGYKYIFPEGLPSGLPPTRSVERGIDLVPGSDHVKRTI